MGTGAVASSRAAGLPASLRPGRGAAVSLRVPQGDSHSAGIQPFTCALSWICFCSLLAKPDRVAMAEAAVQMLTRLCLTIRPPRRPGPSGMCSPVRRGCAGRCRSAPCLGGAVCKPWQARCSSLGIGALSPEHRRCSHWIRNPLLSGPAWA